jgi:hypothetical protein
VVAWFADELGDVRHPSVRNDANIQSTAPST